MQSPEIAFVIKVYILLFILKELLTHSEIWIVAYMDFVRLRHKMSMSFMWWSCKINILTFSTTGGGGGYGCWIMTENAELAPGCDVFKFYIEVSCPTAKVYVLTTVTEL